MPFSNCGFLFFFFNCSAIVISSDFNPFFENGNKTGSFEDVIPDLIGYLPVKSAALLGVQTGSAT